MISLSKKFRQALYENDRNYSITADITLLNNTQLHLTNEQIWSGGVEFDDAVGSDDDFNALGSTVINTASIVINNISETYSDYDFTDATVVIYVAKTFGSTTETIKKGTYHVDEATYEGSLISLSLMDFMAEFEEPYSTSTLTYPATLAEIVRDACSRCDVGLQTLAFPHSDYSVPARPEADSLTYREVIGWCAAIAGCFARCNRDGKLELKWFDQITLESIKEDIDGGVFSPWQIAGVLDGQGFNPWTEGPDADMGDFAEEKAIHYINSVYQESISVDDVVITQIKLIVKTEDESGSSIEQTFSAGAKGYTIEIQNNEFISVDTAQEVANWLGNQLIGLTFRKASITHANTPSIEAGDIALVWDRKGREYPILITRTAFRPYGQQDTVCGSQTPKRNSATRYSSRSKAYVDARKLVKREMTDREKELEKLAEKLAAHSGLYSTAETQSDGSTIYYLHDMPDLADSQTVWKMTKEAWGVSTDGGQHWNGGMTVDGDTIVRILTATGVNADWIDSGALTITKNKGQSNAYELFYANASNGTLRIHAKDTSGNDTFVINSATGDVTISAAKTKVGNKSLETYITDLSPEMTKTQIFNKLTDNGATQGIYMKDGKLYLNGSYLAAGTIASVNGNTKWDLSDGTFTMSKGSISLGSRFSVSSSGYLECSEADISGTITCGNYGRGYWAKLNASGELAGGYQSSRYGYIDFSGSATRTDTGASIHGLQFQASQLIRITSPIIAVAQSSSISTPATICSSGTLDVIEWMNVGSDGTISWRTATYTFRNGLLTSSL